MQGGSKQTHGAGQAQCRGSSKGQQASPQAGMSGCVLLAAGVNVYLSCAHLAEMRWWNNQCMRLHVIMLRSMTRSVLPL